MLKIAFAVLSAALVVSPVYAKSKLVTLASANTTKVTADKIETLARTGGLNVFARIDHAAGAHSIGEKLRPTELLIVGNPKGGTPLLQCSQLYGIDLPLHILVWEDAEGKSWLSYTDLGKLGPKIEGENCDTVLKRLSGALVDLVSEAAKQ